MKKRSLEPPKLPWSKNKINSNPHLFNPQNSDLPGSKSLMSLDSSVPPEMTASSLSDSPKVLKSSSKIAPLKGKEEALTQMVTKWRSKVSVKQQQQNKPSKSPATNIGNNKVITVSTTSSRSTLNSSNSTPAKSSVVFLSNCNKTSTRLVSKIKDSPTAKTVSKNEICQVDCSSGIPVTSGPIGSKTKAAANIKRKSIDSTNQAALPSNRNPRSSQTKTNENNLSSAKPSPSTLAQVKSSSLSSLVRLGVNNSNNLIPPINSSQAKIKPKSSEITADKSSLQKSSSPGLKSSAQCKGLDDQSKRFCERRPKSGSVARNMLKPLILYLNKPDVGANECLSKAASITNESHSNNVQDLRKDDQENVTSQAHQFVEKDETIVSNSNADNSFLAGLNPLNPTSKETSDSLFAEIKTTVISVEEPSTSSQECRETAILDSSFETQTFEQPLERQSPAELKIIVDSCCTEIDVDVLSYQETKPKHQETTEAACRPSFPLCSSPSPSFTSSDNSYSDNDWDDCENYKRDACEDGSKIFEFWFDQESPIVGANGTTLCTSPDEESKATKSEAENTFDDQTKLVRLLKKCQLQTGISDDIDEESEPGVIRTPDEDYNNQMKQKLYHAQQNFSEIGNHQGAISTKAFTNQYFHPRICNPKSNLESKRTPCSETYDFFNRGEYLEASDHRLNASEDMRNLLEWLKIENNELESRCNQLSRENSSLTELLKLSRRDLEISDLKNQQNKTETETELERLRSEKGRLLDQLQLPDNDHGLLVAMEGEIAQYKHRIDQLELQRSEAAQEVKDLKKDLEEAKLEAEEIRDRFSQEDNRDLRRLRDDLDCCVRECRLLHFKNRQTEKKCDLYKVRISDLEASLNVRTNKSSKTLLKDHEVESQINSGHLEQSQIDLTENIIDKQQDHSNVECVERLKEELKEAREVSIRLHEECERLTKDCLKYSEALSSSKRCENDLNSSQSLIPKEKGNIPRETSTISRSSDADNFEETISNSEDLMSKKRLEELEVENKRLMEVLVYLRRKLEHTNGESGTLDIFKLESANLIDHSNQKKCFQHPDLKVNIHPSIQEFQADDSKEPSEGENVKMSVPVSPPQMRPLFSPAIEISEINRCQDLLPTNRDKMGHQKENELMSSVMARHRQEMNSLLQTLRRKERQFSEERKILRRKNLELSEMFDLLAERATTPGQTCSTINQDSQTESSWFEVEERLNRLENEIKERITAEQISRRQLAEMERELHEKITDYEEKLNVMVENVARKNKAIERKEHMIVRLTCSATELEKTLIEKCREIEEKEQKYNGMSMNLLEMEEKRIKYEEENELLKKKLNELEKQRNPAIDARESLQKPLKSAKGLNESQVFGNHAREESHLKETQNLNSEDMKAKVNDAFPEVVMRSRTKTPHPHSSRRSRSLSEMEHVITACMNDINCTYSLVPLKSITKIPSSLEPQKDLTTSTKFNPTINIKTCFDKVDDLGVFRNQTSERRDNRLMNAEKIYFNFNGRRPDTLSLKSSDFAYPATPPSMVLTPTSTLPDSSESLPLKEFVTNSSGSATFCLMNSDQPDHDAQDLMSSSLYEKPVDFLTSVHDHSFTLPRSVKFAEPTFTEENVLETLARAFDRNSMNRYEFKCREGKHRSSSLSPRTARKRFLFSTLEHDGSNTRSTSKFMGNNFLEQHNPPHSLTITPCPPLISSTSGDGSVSNNASRDVLAHEKKGYSGSKETSDKVSSLKGVESSKFRSSESGPCFSSLNQSLADSSPRSGMPSKLLSLLVDPFKKLKKSGSNKTSTSQASSSQLLSNNLKTCEISDRSMTPPARFFRETKPKKRSARKPDSGSLPSLIQLSCLPSI